MGVLNDNIVGGAAGVSTGQETWALSSNDWDYSYNNDIWHAGGNVLGDHTVGGFVSCPTTAGGNYGLRSLFTLDGDFEIAWTHSDSGLLVFGVYAIDEDDVIAGAAGTTDLEDMTNSFWYRTESFTDFFIGSTQQSDANTFADGSAVKITRASGTIKVYDDGALVHTYGTTYAGTMRLAFTSDGAGTPEIDNIFITDSEGVQRDGFYDETQYNSSAIGNYASGSIYAGRRWIATRTGTLASLSFEVRTVSTGSNFHVELWSGTMTSPVSKVGSDTNTINITSTGKKTFTFSTEPDVTKGQVYWAVIEDEDHASTNANIALWEIRKSDIQDSGAGHHDEVTSITDNNSTAGVAAVYQMEAVINTTEEPTPDWDTLLLIQDEGANDSQTFTDSSQLNLTCTANNQVHWDNGQNLGYGTTSIYVDGTDDDVSLADNDRWSFPGDFTIELILRCTDVSIKRQFIEQRTSGVASGHGWNIQIDTAGVLQGYANASGGTQSVTCGAISNNTNYHVAFVRSGTNLGLALDGTWGTVGTLSGAINNIATTVTIGSGKHVIADFIGWMKRVRITNDARWEPGTNFTPPSGNYPAE